MTEACRQTGLRGKGAVKCRRWTSRSSGRCASVGRTVRSSSARRSSARCWRCCCSSYRDGRRLQRPPDRRPVGRGPAADGRQGAAGPRLPAAARARRRDPIVTRPSGYAIRLDPGSLDLARFETLVGAGPQRAARGGGRAAARGARAVPRPAAGRRAALRARQRRGRPARRAAPRRARAPRSSSTSTLGRNRELVVRARGADRRAPVPRALPRAADARALPRRPPGRRAGGLPPRPPHAVEDLGLDPSRELQRLEAAILAQDPTLDLAAAPAPAAAPRPKVAAPPPPLPAPATPLLGRDEDLETARELLPTPTCGCSRSPGRAGSARRGSRWSSRTGSASEFAEGARFVALAALDDPALVAASSSRRSASPPTTASCCWWSTTSSSCSTPRRRSARVLARSPRSKLVVTSRAPLRLAAEHELALGAAGRGARRRAVPRAAPAPWTRGCSWPTATSR